MQKFFVFRKQRMLKKLVIDLVVYQRVAMANHEKLQFVFMSRQTLQSNQFHKLQSNVKFNVCCSSSEKVSVLRNSELLL